MADLRPFRGLRYRPDIAADLGSTLAPPYDVIDSDEEAALHERSPYNIVRVELAEPRPDEGSSEDRYAQAAATLRNWRASGALVQEERPAFYSYVQEFEHEGHRRRRTALIARLRLEPWSAGVVRPHEETGAAAKQDRLQLLRQLRTNVSPIFALYRNGEGRDDEGGVARLISESGAPLVAAATPDGQRHTLSAITDDAVIEAISAALREAPLYIADGHHRYETALTYRDERQRRASAWTGEEPENFVLVALTAVDDPGLTLLPIHRLVRPASLPPDLVERLERFFHVADTTPKSYDGTALLRLLARQSAASASGTAFGALGLEEGRLHLLTLKDRAAARSLMPRRSTAWQALDVSVLQYAILRETLGLDDTTGALDYTEDAERAMREVELGRWPLAFLLSGTRVEQILAVADAGERMPRKSTFFYPKLATGLVLHAFD